MICKSWQYPSHPSIQFPSSAFPLLLLFLLSRATSRLVPCIMHTSSLSLSSIDAVGHFEKGDQGDVCNFDSTAFSWSRSFKERSYRPDTRRTILADDDASMFHGNHKPWRIHFGISIIYRPSIVSMPSSLLPFVLSIGSSWRSKWKRLRNYTSR